MTESAEDDSDSRLVALWEQFSGVSAGSLDAEQGDKALTTPDKAVLDEAAAAAARKANQTHVMREELFGTLRKILVAIVGAAAAITVLYIVSQWGEVDATVIISFNAAVVVNCIGLVYIIAKYLFPEGGGD